MQEMDPTYEYGEALDADVPPSLSTHTLRRLLYLALAALVILLLVLLPPLISLNRYQKRIANSIGDSLGRPVHLDRVSLNLLPLPGFTLERFVVDEDPAFGSEPVIRPDSVRVTLRISSLLRPRVEFSTITFTDPSANLAHLPHGNRDLVPILRPPPHTLALPHPYPLPPHPPRHQRSRHRPQPARRHPRQSSLALPGPHQPPRRMAQRSSRPGQPHRLRSRRRPPRRHDPLRQRPGNR